MDTIDLILQRRRLAREVTAIQSHNCSIADWLARYEQHVPRFLHEGAAGLEALNRKLYWFFCDSKNLTLAATHIRDRGGTAPGPDGRSVAHLNCREEFFGFVKDVHDELRHHRYRPGPVRKRMVRKASGSGRRPIILMNLADRVVHRAAMQVLRPIFRHVAERRYGLPACVGLSREWLLARVEQLSLHGKPVLVVDDLRDAFEHVPQKRVIEIAFNYLGGPSERMQKFIRDLVRSGKKSGLKQGAATSSMFLDLHLFHTLERPWAAKCPDWPILRYADDLAIATASPTQAQEAAQALHESLTPIGMTPKAIAAGVPVIRNLADGESVDYLGFTLSMRGGEVVFDLPPTTYDKLCGRLVMLAEQGRELEMEDNYARRMIGWAQQQGPAFREERIEPCWEAFRDLGEELGLPPPLPLEDFRDEWLWAKMRFDRIRQRVAADFVEGDEFE